MHSERRLGFLRVKDFHHIASRGLQLARIAHLAARLTVKGSLGGDDLHFFTFAHNTPTGFSLHQGGEDLGFPLDNAITDKTRAQVSQSSVDIDRALLSLAGTGALFLHCPLEPRAVYAEPFGREDILGEIEGKAVGVVQPKGRLSRQSRTTTAAQVFDRLLQQNESLVQGFRESFLLVPYNLSEVVLMRTELRIG